MERVQTLTAQRLRLALTVATAPVIYAMIVPLAFLDLTVSLYQAICFRAWNIERAPRSTFLILDRHRLGYLNGLEKVHCVYCGYANGVLAYAVEVAGLTEQYWCPIKHAADAPFAHSRYPRFAAFGDAEEFARRREPLRQELAMPRVANDAALASLEID
jgi:hypothetical protein